MVAIVGSVWSRRGSEGVEGVSAVVEEQWITVAQTSTGRHTGDRVDGEEENRSLGEEVQTLKIKSVQTLKSNQISPAEKQPAACKSQIAAGKGGILRTCIHHSTAVSGSGTAGTRPHSSNT